MQAIQKLFPTFKEHKKFPFCFIEFIVNCCHLLEEIPLIELNAFVKEPQKVYE